MRNANTSAPTPEESHFFKAALFVHNVWLNEIPCKLYLPERIHEKPHLVLKPSKEDAPQLMGSFNGALKAVIYGFDKQPQINIEAPEIYFSERRTKHWGDDISDCTVSGEPQDLHVIHHLRNHDAQEETRMTFWVSPNKYLSPFLICSNSYTGEIKYERRKSFDFRIKNNVQLSFDKQFSYKTAPNGDLTQWSFLVARTTLDIPADDADTLKNTVLEDVDDFLLIASFAARKRTACLGWNAADSRSYTSYYRGNYTFPEDNENSEQDDGTIDFQHFEKFMEKSYSAFSLFQNKFALRNSLYSVVPTGVNTVETSFLKMFAGLESLILDFRRTEGLEFILPVSDWIALKKHLQHKLHESTQPTLDPSQRASINRKLSELNRVPLEEAFTVFSQRYAIELADLWPVFGKNGAVGLSEIRNNLIHGDPYPHDLFGTLIVAKEHLRYTLERTLVRILGWDVEETKVSPVYVKANYSAINNLATEQNRMSDYIGMKN